MAAFVFSNRRAHTQALSMLLCAQLCLSSGGIMARYALEGMSVPMAGAWRFSLIAVVLLARMVFKRRPLLPWRDELALFAAGLLLAEQLATWMLSISYLTLGTATLLYCTTPFWNGLYETWILKREAPRGFWLALCAAGTGVCVMVYDTGSSDVPGHLRLLGIALALASGVGVSAFFILMRRLAKYDPSGENYHPLDLSTRVYTYAALALTFMSVVEGSEVPPLSDWQVWAGVIGMAVITQGVGHTMQNASLRHIRASMVAFAMLLEPLIASVLAWLIFHEAMGVRGALGGALVLVALAWALFVNLPTSRTDAEDAISMGHLAKVSSATG